MAAISLRRKITTSSKKVSSGIQPPRRNMKISCPPCVSAPVSTTNGPSMPQQRTESKIALSRESSDYGTLFNDPRKVHQWAVTSANGSAPFISPELSGTVLANDGFNDLSLTGLDLNYPAEVHSALPFSMLSHSEIPDGPVLQTISSDMFDIPTGISMAHSSEIMYSSDLHFMDNTQSPESYFTEPWSVTDEQLGAPMSVEMTYTTSADSYQHVSSDYLEEPQLQSYWAPTQLHGQGSLSCPSGYHSNEAEWSPPSAGTLDPSVSSSYSQPSFMHQHAGSLPYRPIEDINSVAAFDEYGRTGIPIDGPCQYPYPSSPLETTMDVSRFVSFCSSRIGP